MYSAGVQQLDRAAAERGRHLVAAAAAAAAALASAEQQNAAAATGSGRLTGQASEHYFAGTSTCSEGEPGGPADLAAGAQDAQAEALHQYYTSHAHHAHHHHHYRLSSDSSLSSGSQFAGPASSAAHLHHELHHELQHQHQQHQHHLHANPAGQHMRNLAGHHHHHLHHHSGAAKFHPQALTRRFSSLAWNSVCSRKCLFIACFLVIVLIFILVIGLSAYLNFLINLNKINLSPVSGRLRVEQPGDFYTDQLANRTSKEFLAKQQQYEIILRGALDRTQALLKSYPNHLVKSEVYTFRAQPVLSPLGSEQQAVANLWVYFRLFINKRTLAQDGQLMKRKSPDEHLEKQFLPRLTQQTLQSGFEQLMQSTAELRPRIQSRSAVQQVARQAVSAAANQVRSFDEQISRLMPIIESIDLQSIQISAEFDMLQSGVASATDNQAMSDNLRASQFLTTTSSAGSSSPVGAVMVATGAPEPAISAPRPAPGDAQASGLDEISVSTRKFTLTGYKENTTRPGSTDRSAFLTSHLHRKPQLSGNGNDNANLQTPTSSQAPVRASSSEQPSVVKLVSGQPVTSQAGHHFSHAPKQQAEVSLQAADRQQVSATGNITLFASLPSSRVSSSIQATNQNSTNSSQAHSSSQKQPPAAQMFAPYLKAADFSPSQTSATGNNNGNSSAARNSPQAPPRRKPEQQQVSELGTPASVQDLWASALSGRKNVTILKLDRAQASSDQSPAPVRIMVSPSTSSPTSLPNSTQAGQQKANQTGVDDRAQDWHKISLLSSDIADTIRAQLGTHQSQSSSTASSQAATSAKPKVSPHLRQGGSLISVATQAQPSRQLEAPSAILLNRDLQAGAASGPATTMATLAVSQVAPATTAAPAKLTQQRKPTSRQRQQQVAIKPVINLPASKPQQLQKVRKVTMAEQKAHLDAAGLNITRGIKIVDNFLASIGTDSLNRTYHEPIIVAGGLTLNSSALDQLAPTSPTTIELTRSTAAGVHPGTSPTPVVSTQAAATRPSVTTTPVSTSTTSSSSSSSTTTTTESPGRLRAVSSSNQWRPIATPASTTKRPNLTLIVSSGALEAQRVQANSRLQGSQSPFAMPAGALTNQQLSRAGAGRGQPAEFESHRMSRMRQQMSASEPEVGDSSSPGSLATSTLVIDDFMITTTTSEPRAGFNPVRQAVELPPNSLAGAQIKQTRGPFAFETLKEPEGQVTTSSSRLERSSEPTDEKLLVRKKLLVGGLGAGGSAASPPVRPRGAREESADGSEPLKQRARFGNRKASVANALTAATSPITHQVLSGGNPPTPLDLDELDPVAGGSTAGRLDQSERASLNLSTSSSSTSSQLLAIDGNEYSARCQYYGCKAKSSLRFTCLNQTQICDDFIDCQDESDELDCVSLLKQDAKTKRLSFSNGEGIIYLNRKGSLAPMCIDYFLDSSGGGDFDSSNDVRKQQELVRQINTIGQYACSLQSFSKLVSVKINHHQSVDNSNLIKASKHYHRLSIIDSSETSTTAASALETTGLAGGGRDKSLDGTFGSYKASGLLGQHEVEVSTTPDCPSQRTVFVKCGTFECGQDSFSVSAGSPASQTADQSSAKRKGGVIINDFPWLVKLYYMGSLACHGYLIDELWLISSSECFMSNMSKVLAHQQSPGQLGISPNAWTAEISYEHYGNHDYQSIESNRRSIKDILVYPGLDSVEFSSLTDKLEQHIGGQAAPLTPDPSIVLAKLEKPVRFSPLNRPICLPLTASPPLAQSSTPATFGGLYKECVTATLPTNTSLPAHLMPPTQELLLNKVRVQRTSECIDGSANTGRLRFSLDDLICVAGLAQDSPLAGQQELGARGIQVEVGQLVPASSDATHVLICSTTPSTRSRSRWTIVGVQNKATGFGVHPNRLLFTAISSLSDWIIDTMNPNPRQRAATVLTNSLSGGGGSGGGGGNNDIGSFSVPHGENLNEEFNPMKNRSLLSTDGETQACIQFRCSSGECLTWSRICDGLYDCSSHDDEKDCHK